MKDQTIPVSRVDDLIHALEECEEHHRAAGDDYVASQWRQAANMTRNTLLASSLEDLSIRDGFDRDDYLWCQAAIGADMHGVIVGWDDEDCPILVTQEGYHGPEYPQLVRPLTHLPRMEWPAGESDQDGFTVRGWEYKTPEPGMYDTGNPFPKSNMKINLEKHPEPDHDPSRVPVKTVFAMMDETIAALRADRLRREGGHR